MTLPKNETGIVTVTHKRYSVFRFLLTSCLVGLRRSFARRCYQRSKAATRKQGL